MAATSAASIRAYQTSSTLCSAYSAIARQYARSGAAGGPLGGGGIGTEPAGGDGDAGGEAGDVPLERSRDRLVEVVDVEHEVAFGRREAAEVEQVGVAAQLHAQPGDRAPMRGRPPSRRPTRGGRRRTTGPSARTGSAPAPGCGSTFAGDQDVERRPPIGGRRPRGERRRAGWRCAAPDPPRPAPRPALPSDVILSLRPAAARIGASDAVEERARGTRPSAASGGSGRGARAGRRRRPGTSSGCRTSRWCRRTWRRGRGRRRPRRRCGRCARPAARVVAQAAALPMLPDRHDGGSVVLVGLSPMTITCGAAAARRAIVLSAPAAHVAASSSYCV